MIHRRQSRKERAKATERANTAEFAVRKSSGASAPARFRAYLWAMSLTFGYGVVNSAILGRAERQVSIEAVLVCVAVLGVHVVLYYTRPMRSLFAEAIVEQLWRAVQGMEQRRLARIAAVSAFLFVLIANAIPLSAVEPALATWLLKKSNAGLVPGLDSDLADTPPAFRFREISNRVEKSLKARIPNDSRVVSRVRTPMENTLQGVRLPVNIKDAASEEVAHLQTYQTFSTIAAVDPLILGPAPSTSSARGPWIVGAGSDETKFVLTPDFAGGAFMPIERGPFYLSGFSIMSFGHNPGKPVPAGISTADSSASIVLNDVKLVGLAQDIGNLTWINSTFVGCLIRYHGQRLRMGRVTFVNCIFEKSADGKGAAVLDFISKHTAESINIYVP